MALIVNRNEQRSKLQESIAAELQERAREKAAAAELPDGVEDSQFIKGTKQTTSLAWAWIILALIAVGIVIWIITLILG